MMLRDLPQPFTGIRTLWLDRGSILEDAWAEASKSSTDEGVDGERELTDVQADVFDGTDGSTGTKTLNELGVEWWGSSAPAGSVLLLNGTSATDGCRVLIANVGELPASNSNCLLVPKSPADPNVVVGPVSGSLDGLAGLLPWTGNTSEDHHTCPANATEGNDTDAALTLRATTAGPARRPFPLRNPLRGAAPLCPRDRIYDHRRGVYGSSATEG
ncbi:MAG: hypothetical protein WKF73_15710 [Nocardioidaceae bacterium]